MTYATVRMLLTKAENDLKVTHTLLHTDELYNDIIAFHIQQSMEKNLIAYLVSQLITVDKTHDLIVLHKRC